MSLEFLRGKRAFSCFLMRIPFLRPNPPKLSNLNLELRQIEESGIFTNYGPVNTCLEQALVHRLFGGLGQCVTVCNGTIGLMLAIRHVVGATPDPRRRYALMPSFTFAATAHAALWVGLRPLLSDIDPATWVSSAGSEEELLRKFAGEVAVVVPCATFGTNLDLEHYTRISGEYRVPIVVDAAASLGSRDKGGRQFGAGFEQPVVFSMHTTKAFATAEAGLIYCAESSAIDALRAMGNFGFGKPRVA